MHMSSFIHWVCELLVLALAPVVALTVFVVVTVTSPEPRSYALVVFSALIAAALSLACLLRFRNAQLVKNKSKKAGAESTYRNLQSLLYKLLRPSAANVALLHSSAIILAVTLLVRLLATDQFGGKPTNLDFGMKSSGDEANIAMTNSGSTVGHVLQGFLASFFSFPSVVGIISRLLKKKRTRTTESSNSDTGGISMNDDSLLGSKPNVLVMVVLQLAAACMTIYPTYSGIKRYMKAGGDSFARNSHLNNTSEWVLGYFLGIGIGWLGTVLLQCRFYRLSRLTKTGVGACSISLCCGAGDASDGDNGENENDKIQIEKVLNMLNIEDELQESGDKCHESAEDQPPHYGFGKAHEYEYISSPRMVMTCKIVSKVCILLLAMLSISSLLTGLFIGLTWNDDDSKGSAPDVAMTTIFVGIYIVVTVLMVWFSTRKWPFQNQD